MAIGCVSNIRCKPKSVKVYDSLLTGDVPLSTKEMIATIMNISSKIIYIFYPNVQQQDNTSSCGLYSLAFAYTLCEGGDSSKFSYTKKDLWIYYYRCINESAKIISFPSKRALYEPSKPQKLKFIALADFLTQEMTWSNVQHARNGFTTLVLILIIVQKLKESGTVLIVTNDSLS